MEKEYSIEYPFSFYASEDLSRPAAASTFSKKARPANRQNNTGIFFSKNNWKNVWKLKMKVISL